MRAWSASAVCLLLVALPAAAQVPSGIHVTLGGTVGDAGMSPPDVSHLVLHWSTAQPYTPAQAPTVLWSVDGGPELATAAFLAGVARDTSPTQEGEVQPQYAARLAPVPRGANVTYRITATGLGATEPATVRMIPFEDAAVRIAALAHIGYEGYDRVTRARLPGVPAPAEDAVNATLALAPDLLLLPGNIAMTTSLRPWDITLSILQPLAGTVPTMLVSGPNEAADDFHHLRERFVLPLAEPGRVGRTTTYTGVDDLTHTDDSELMYHGFSAGPVYVIGLSVEALCKPLAPQPPLVAPPQVGIPPCAVGQLDPVQTQWLHDVLEDAREDYNATWILVHLGQGPYVHADDGPNTLVEQVWRPLLETYGVDLVLYSQEPIYQRTYPMAGGQPTTRAVANYKAGAGTVYLNTGGGGWGPTEALPTPAPAWLASLHEGGHTLTFDATQRTLAVTARAVADGGVLDSFTLHKPASGGYAAAAGGPAQQVDLPPENEAPLPGAVLALGALGVALARRLRR